MKNTVDPLELIRHQNPIPEPKTLALSTSAETLRSDIDNTDEAVFQPTTARRGVGRVAGLAAALVIATAGTAVAAGVFSPDQEDLATIDQHFEPHAEVHLEGWRPVLSTEFVWCMYEDGTGASTPASEFPMSEPMTVETLLAECRDGNDAARNLAAPPEVFTLCRGTFTQAEYERRLREDDRFHVDAGDLAGERPGFPVVLGWQTECARASLQTTNEISLQPFHSLDETNRARQVETWLKATAIRSCLSLDEAEELARSARDHLGETWLLLDAELVAVDCHEVWLDPQWGTIYVDGR